MKNQLPEEQNRHLTKKDILEITYESMGKTLNELGLLNNKQYESKGGVGTFVEEVVFGYPANSYNEPDFVDAGIELKVTPYKNIKDGYSSKERLVLNIINYEEEAKATFKTSSFYRKNSKLLIWFYHWLQNKPMGEYKITNYKLFEFEQSVEYAIIKRDWEIIHKKIMDGKAHEISESDTMFLAACTKGADSSSVRNQPFSNIPAKQRAYSLKTGFMSKMLRTVMNTPSLLSSFATDNELKENSLETIYKIKLSNYINKTQRELMWKFGLQNSKAKQINAMLASRMLNIENGSYETQEMADANIKMKTVVLDKNGTPCESMSFKNVDFTDLITVSWDDSNTREEFVDIKLMLIVFKTRDDGQKYFADVVFWNIPTSIVDGPIKNMYESCANLIKNGDALYYDEKGNVIDRFPKEKRNSNGVCHVRPKGKNALDVMILPVKDKITNKLSYTKQCFWFNKDFVKKMLIIK